jgi:lipopolysaccharide export LptBFGC system permease protein LptF
MYLTGERTCILIAKAFAHIKVISHPMPLKIVLIAIRYTAQVLRRMPSYLLRETAGIFVLSVAAVSLLLSIDFLVVFARFLVQQDVGFPALTLLLTLKVPWFLHLSLPVAVIFSVLLATGRLAKDSELKAAYLLGVNPISLLMPLTLFGIGVSVLTLVNNGWVEPIAERSYRSLVESFFYSRPPPESRLNVSYAIEGEGIFFASRVRVKENDPKTADLDGILVLLDDGRTITSKRGIWRSGDRIWELVNAEVSTAGGKNTLAGSLALPFGLNLDPSATLARSETLTLGELHRKLRHINDAGGVTREITFNLHRRLADAGMAGVFVVISGALGLHLRKRTASFAWAIILLLSFWTIWTLTGDLHDRGLGNPVVFAWLTPAIVGVVGLGLVVSRVRT